MNKHCGLWQKYYSNNENMKNYLFSEFVCANCPHDYKNCTKDCEYYIQDATQNIILTKPLENRIREIAREEILKFMQQPVSISSQGEASKINIHGFKNGECNK